MSYEDKNFDPELKPLSHSPLEVLNNWSAKRAGGYITITHASGKVVNVVSITPQPGHRRIIAKTSSNDVYELNISF